MDVRSADFFITAGGKSEKSIDAGPTLGYEL
jgi:hypothetical protein